MRIDEARLKEIERYRENEITRVENDVTLLIADLREARAEIARLKEMLDEAKFNLKWLEKP